MTPFVVVIATEGLKYHWATEEGTLCGTGLGIDWRPDEVPPGFELCKRCERMLT